MYIGNQSTKDHNIKKILSIIGTIILVLVAVLVLIFYFKKESIVKTMVPVSKSVEPYSNSIKLFNLDEIDNFNAGNMSISNISIEKEEAQMVICFYVTNNINESTNFQFFPLNLYNSNNLCIGKLMIAADIVVPANETVSINGVIPASVLSSTSSLLEIEKIEFCRYVDESEGAQTVSFEQNVDVETRDDITVPFTNIISNTFSIEKLNTSVNVKSAYQYYTVKLAGNTITYGERNYGLEDLYGGYIAFNMYDKNNSYIGKVYDESLNETTLTSQSTQEAEIVLDLKYFVDGYNISDLAYIKLALLYEE